VSENEPFGTAAVGWSPFVEAVLAVQVPPVNVSKKLWVV
jgi:hypothetical protein